MLCDALGLPLKFILTAGEASDSQQAIPLLKGETAEYVLADKGYDADEIVNYIEVKMGAEAVVPPRSNRIVQRKYDTVIYKERNKIERLFNRLKQFRKLAFRIEKIQKNFESLIYMACIYLWLI